MCVRPHEKERVQVQTFRRGNSERMT